MTNHSKGTAINNTVNYAFCWLIVAAWNVSIDDGVGFFFQSVTDSVKQYLFLF